MDELRKTLEAVNDWLKFAEAKNAILVATSGFALWSSIRLIIWNEIGFYAGIYFAILSICLVGGFVTSLLSFLPVLNYQWIVPIPGKVANKNIIYFGYLGTLSKNKLLAEYMRATESKETDVKIIHEMFAEQIIINSKITLAKYNMFERAIKIILFGILTPVIAIPVLYFSDKRRRNVNDI